MSYTVTIELEHACGEDIDVDRVSEVLRSMDIKVRGSKPGSHLLSAAALMRASESVFLAVALVLGDGEEDGDACTRCGGDGFIERYHGDGSVESRPRCPLCAE